LALGGKEPDSSWFEVSDPRLASALRVPRVRRSYLRSLQEVLDGPYREGRLEALFDERTQALHAAGVHDRFAAYNCEQGVFEGASWRDLRTELARHAASFTAVQDPQSGTTTSPRTLHGTAACRGIHPSSRTSAGDSLEKCDRVDLPKCRLNPRMGHGKLRECVGIDRFGAPVPQARIVLRW
jgi:hypothetical protein